MGRKTKAGTTLNMEAVIIEITEMRLKKFSSKYTIVNYLIEKYKITNQHAYAIVKRMEEKIVDIYTNNITKQVELAISKLETIQEKALLVSNLKVALACEVEINKIKGLYVNRIEQTNKEDTPLFSDKDLGEE